MSGRTADDQAPFDEGDRGIEEKGERTVRTRMPANTRVGRRTSIPPAGSGIRSLAMIQDIRRSPRQQRPSRTDMCRLENTQLMAEGI